MNRLPVFILIGILWIAPRALEASEFYRLHIDGLACSFCAYGVEKKLKNTEGVEDVKVRINEGLVQVIVSDDADFSEARARQIVEDSGFSLREFEKEINGR